MQAISSAQDLHAKDVSLPGLWKQRKKEVKEVEEQAGAPVLAMSWLNRGTNFSSAEREELRLEGLLPPVIESLELQAERVMSQLREPNKTDLQRYSILNQLLSSNQTLYYKVLCDNIEELAPIVYTPTVGEACLKFDRIYRAPLGLYLSSFRHRGRFEEVLSNWPSHNVQIIVVTDGSRILGLGDLGTNGIGISIGKVALYVAGGGFHPEHSLPIVLDVGCNNPRIVEDKFYLGERRPRLGGDEYFGVIDEFTKAVKALWPNALLQFEDFQTERAFEILHRHRSKLLCFNDDIQGTGAVVTSGFVNGMKFQKTPLDEARVVFYGAGSSAVGVADQIATYMQQKAGISNEEARRRIFMVDSKGLITATRGDKLPEHKQRYARNDGTPDMKDLKDIIAHVKPHALIGLSAAGPSWPQPVIEELCAHVPCPLVFPLSNPTDKAEITAEQAYTWSKGQCVFASGSPFAPVEVGAERYMPGQANNVFVFPGIGFGSVMAKAKAVTDEMLVAASQAVADAVSGELLDQKQIYPNISELREVSAQVAAAVARAAHECGVSQLAEAPADWLDYVTSRMWAPEGRTTKASGMAVHAVNGMPRARSGPHLRPHAHPSGLPPAHCRRAASSRGGIAAAAEPAAAAAAGAAPPAVEVSMVLAGAVKTQLLRLDLPASSSSSGSSSSSSPQQPSTLWLAVTKARGGRVEAVCAGEVLQLSAAEDGTLVAAAAGFAPRLDEAWVKGVPGLADSLKKIRQQQAADGSLPSQLIEACGGAALAPAGTFAEFCGRVAADPRPWCDGTGPGDAPLSKEEQALLTAGELAAFLAGRRGVCLLQLRKGWGDAGGGRQPLLRPWVLTLLQQAAGHRGATLLASAAPGDPALGATLVLCARQQPFLAWGKRLAGLGVQSSIVADSPWYKLFIGRILGYKHDNIAHHIESTGGRLSSEVVEAVEKELAALSSAAPALPWGGGGGRKR